MTPTLIAVDPAGLHQIITEAVREAVTTAFATQTPASASASDLLSRSEVQQMLHISLSTLHEWEKRGLLIPSRAGRRVLYRRADIDRMLSTGGTR